MKQDHARTVDPGKHYKGAGPVRKEIPVYQDFLPPCNSTCPAGENIQQWLNRAMDGRFREAWDVLTADNPSPAIMGRVCYHPCETACNRGQHDTPVGIHAIERYIGDLAMEENWAFAAPAKDTGKKVL